MPDSAYSLLFSSENKETQTPSTGEAAVGAAAPAVGGSGSSAFGLLFGGSSASSPGNGQQSVGPATPPQHLYQDPSQSWYSRAWDWANTPLLDSSVFGLPEDLGMGGFGRGVEHIAAGLTSPLSLALAAATFGSGGFIAGAGETALKESGEFTAAQIADAISASKIALKTAKSMPDIEPVISGALKAGGHDLGLLERARALTFPINRDAELASEELQKNLSEVGLSEAQRTALKEGTLSEAERSAIATANTKMPGFSTDELKALSDTGDTVAKAKSGFLPLADAVRDAGYNVDNWKKATAILSDKKLDVTKDLLGGNLLQRGAFQILHKAAPDVSFGALTKAADTANTVMNWGFTYQQLETAAQMSPRFFDALKEGDADHAWEYGTEMFASGAMGALGAPHALRSAGELFNPLLGSTDVPRLSDRWLAIERVNKDREAAHAVAEQDAVNKYNTAFDLLGLRKAHPVLGLSKEDKAFNTERLAECQTRIATETDPEKARVLHNVLVEAQGGGEYQPIPAPLGTPLADNEAPPRAGTKSVATTSSGEVRVGSDGRPVVWLSPEDYGDFQTIAQAPGTGVNYSPREADILLSRFNPESSIGQLISKARQLAGPTSVLKTPGENPEFSILVAQEEAQHAEQRWLSQNGEVYNLLDGATRLPSGEIKVEPGSPWDRLHGIIPTVTHSYFDSLDYDQNPVVRVAETAAKYQAGVDTGASKTERINFLDEYFKELEAKHGPQAREKFARINEIARQHVEDIYAERQAAEARASGLAEQGTGAGSVRRLEEGGEGGAGQGAEGEWYVYDGEGHLLDSFPTHEEATKAAESEGTQAEVRFEPTKGKQQGLASRVRELDENKDLRRVYHWSRKPDFTETNPELAGTGVRGAERDRLQVPGTYFGEESYREPAVQGNSKKYFANLDYNKIYDRAKDPLSLVDQARKLTRKNGDPIEYNLEKLLQQKGFSGYRAQNVVKSFEPVKVFRDYGIVPTSAEKFHSAISQVKKAHESSGADQQLSVYSPEEYKGMKTFMSPDGKTGIALDGDLIVSKFSHPTDTPRANANLMRVAIENGGRRSDGFDTYLPAINAREGMKVVARLPWNDAYAPEGWNYDKMKQYNGGHPDVVFMAYDPTYKGPYEPGQGVRVDSYQGGEAVQKAALRGEPISPLSGLASREKPAEWEDIKSHLTPEEVQKHDTPEKQNLLTAAFNSMPDHEEWTAAIRAGKAGQLWYERSTRAFDALIDSGIPWLGKADKDKFLNFTAALSPVQPVQANLRMALNLWAKWDKAGRPQDVTWKDGKVASKNASLYRVLAGRGETQGVDLPARMGNAIHALQGEPLSGPKVSSFTKNLGKDSSRVTNDTWMAVFGDHDPNRINKPAVYDAMSAKVREAAKAEGVEPRQAQAAIWCFIKSLAELSGWGNDRWIPPQEIIKQGLLTPELVAQHSADFADMLKTNPEIRGVIKKLGGDLNALDTKLETYVPRKPSTGEAAGSSPELLNAAGRLEAARRDSRIASHLARKSGASLFDTEFGPDNGLFSKEKDNRAPVWYLKSNQLVDSRMQGPMPADTVLKMLENNGVKPDELKYTGLSDFLREKGSAPVRPEEVKDYLAANNLQVQEVTKQENTPPPDRISRQLYGRDYGGLSEDQREVVDSAVNRWDAGEKFDPAKFGTYTLPGAEPGSYRELLMTLPNYGQSKNVFDYNEDFRSAHWDEPNVVGHVRFNDRTGPNGEKLLHLEELQSDWHQKGRTQGYNLDPARIESLRKEASDLRERLKDPVTDEELANYFKPGNIVNSYGGKDKVISFHPADPNGKGWDRVWSVKVHAIDPETGELDPREYDRTHSTRPDAGDVHPELQARLNEISKETVHSGVPDAPFKKTDEWTGLFFKRMIRYAAENGYDGISWTPGVEHFNRWGSERFDWEKTEDGKWTVAGTYQHGGNAGGVDLEGEATRRGLLNKSGGQVKSQADLRAIVHRVLHIAGREKVDAVTKKLWDRMQTEPTGASMPRKEGFESYYDQITPQVANKLGKQFGAKVGETKIKVSDGSKTRIYEGPTLSTADLDKIASEAEGTQLEGQARAVAYEVRYSRIPFAEAVRDFGSEAYAEKIGGKLNIQKEVKTSAVPYFPITDSMRESVLHQGQPLFSRESPDNGHLPPNIDDMIQNNVFKDKPKEYRDLVMSVHRKAATTAPDPQMKSAMDFIRNEHDRSFEIGSTNDILQHYIDDYFQRTWDNSNPEGRVISSDAKNGKFATNVTMARRRVYDSTLTGLLKSPKQLKFDIVNNMARGRAEIIKAAANRQFIRSLRDDFSRGSDGRPAVVLAGSGRVVTGQDGEDPKTFISPDRVQKINIAQSNIDEMKKTGYFDRFLADGTIKDITPHVHPDNIGMAIDRLEKQALSKNAQYDEMGNNKLRTDLMYLKSMLANKDYSGLREFNGAQKPVYAWDPQDYVTLDHNAMRGWNFVTNDSAGHGILVDADIKAHPEFAQYLKNRLGLEESGIAKNPIGKALLGAGSAAKHVLLSLSPFHMVQIGLRGVMTGINPFTLHGPDLLDGAKIDPSNPHSETKLLAMVRQGYTTGTDFRGQQQMSEGLSTGGDALRRIPGIGNTIANSMNWYQDFLFKRYIPAMKATAGEHLFDQYRASHPEWSNDRVAKAAALHANESFGGINWRAMGRSTTTQDWGRLMLLAPDWLESEMRSGARLFNREEGNIGRKQVVMMTLGMWGIARVLNTLSTGSPHLEAPFGLAVKNKEGKEIIFGMRTLPTDLLHAATDPVGFIKGRLSPTIHAGQELLTQRDSFGRKLGPEDLWADVFHNMMPIPGQAIGQAVTGTGPQVGTVGQVWKAGGGTAQVYATPAQKMAAELAANHNEDGPIDKAQMDRHRRIMDLEDQVRSGETSWPELVKLAYNTDQLKESELKKIQLNLTKTKGMDSTMASLYTRASRLPAAEFFKLFDTMNNSEKTALIPLTQSVMKRYTAKAMKDMTPSERAKDPVLQRILNMMHPGGIPQASAAPAPVIPPAVQQEAAHLNAGVQQYLHTATHPITGHQVASNDGHNWVDRQTGEPING